MWSTDYNSRIEILNINWVSSNNGAGQVSMQEPLYITTWLLNGFKALVKPRSTSYRSESIVFTYERSS